MWTRSDIGLLKNIDIADRIPRFAKSKKIAQEPRATTSQLNYSYICNFSI